MILFTIFSCFIFENNCLEHICQKNCFWHQYGMCKWVVAQRLPAIAHLLKLLRAVRKQERFLPISRMSASDNPIESVKKANMKIAALVDCLFKVIIITDVFRSFSNKPTMTQILITLLSLLFSRRMHSMFILIFRGSCSGSTPCAHKPALI